MTDNKRLKWVDTVRTDADNDASNDDAGNDGELVADAPAANDADGWQQYRRWVSQAPAPAPKRRRATIDPSLYSWKAYRNWSEQVRRAWDAEDDDSND